MAFTLYRAAQSDKTCLLLLFVSYEDSTGSSVKYTGYAYQGTINAYQVCESTAVCAYSAVVAASAVRRCTPATRDVLHTAVVVFTVNSFSISTNKRTLLLQFTPWQYSRFCAASAHLLAYMNIC